MKKIISLMFCTFVFILQSYATETLTLDFPNKGWHQVEIANQKGKNVNYVPHDQSGTAYRELVNFTSRPLRNTDIPTFAMLHKLVAKNKIMYNDIVPYYIKQDSHDSMVLWCSTKGNQCRISRALKSHDGVIFINYVNMSPHYSENIFSNWVNILNSIEIYDSEKDNKKSTIIEL